MRGNTLKVLSLVLALCISISLLPISAMARASDYIASYIASTSANSNNVITVAFTVTANGKMDKIGSTTIYLYEKSGNNSTLKKTFTESAYPKMTASDKYTHSSSVTYQGEAGKSYYAVVYVYAGKDGNGDTRLKTTNTVNT